MIDPSVCMNNRRACAVSKGQRIGVCVWVFKVHVFFYVGVAAGELYNVCEYEFMTQ